MKQLSSAQIRQKFLDYFAAYHHQVVPSSSLIPANDPTLLFVNAGMVQFKEVFLGLEQRDYTRATSVQRCVRAGGKHNDLENVGFTARHHTFFEMLGNFSFGDYFKREAIQFAWNFLTNELELPAEKLWVTVYKDDKEAEDIWLNEIKVDPERFSRCDEKDNFWQMGDTGPCGPCTEIFYDHGPEIAGGPPGSPDEDGDRYIEIWNLVFMQYERQADGQLKPLPKPSVDTGMGLERIAAVIQGVHSNYEIDLFQALIKAVAELARTQDLEHNSLKVIADHIRSCAFLIADGVVPSNEGRGYVLRRIIRRAVRHGNKLGINEPFFYKLVKPLAEQMGSAYPELIEQGEIIEQALLKEEQQFAQTLEHGLGILEQDIKQLSGKVISGETAFKLYDTYGFPVDLTADIARERGLTVDEQGFQKCMCEQRERSQQGSRFAVDYTKSLKIDVSTEFNGYEALTDGANLLVLMKDDGSVNQLKQGEEGVLVLDKTPFYAESGGQVGDKGIVYLGQNIFEVTDTQKIGDAYFHFGNVKEGQFNVGQYVQAEVHESSRRATMANHSATHLLHAALHRVLGKHVVQKGSLVEAERLRFDFSHGKPVTAHELREIEMLVNEQIRANHPVEVTLSTLDEAKAAGVMALFGEKYGDTVRVLKMGDFSQELCGGTHVKRTGDIGIFKIISETGTAAGIRRIEAITADHALKYFNQVTDELAGVAAKLKTRPGSIASKINLLQDKIKEQDKQILQLQQQLASGSGGRDLASSVIDVADVKVLSQQLPVADMNILREQVDHLKDKLQRAVVVLAAVAEDHKVQLVAGVTKNLVEQVKAGELVNFVAQQVGGKGGGRPDMAQAGGNEPAKLAEALESVASWVEQKLK